MVNRLLILLLLAVFTFASLPLPRAQAISQCDLDALRDKTPFFDPCATSNPTCSATTTSATAIVGANNQEKVFNYLASHLIEKAYGTSPMTAAQRNAIDAQVAGIMGNLMAESGVGINPAAYEKPGGDINKGGVGIAQWTAGRRDAIETAGSKDPRGLHSLEFQLDYLWRELVGPYKRSTYDKLILETTPDGAAHVFEKGYERAGIPRMEKRIQYANDMMAKYAGRALTPVSTATLVGTGLPTDCASPIGAAPDISGTHADLASRLFNNPLVSTDGPINRKDFFDGGKCLPPPSYNMVQMSDDLLRALIYLVEMTKVQVRISSTVSDHQCYVSGSTRISNHSDGFAVDIGNEEKANVLYPFLYQNRDLLKLNELIFSTDGASNSAFGAHNLAGGKDEDYKSGTLIAHQNHIHFSVKRGAGTLQ